MTEKYETNGDLNNNYKNSVEYDHYSEPVLDKRLKKKKESDLVRRANWFEDEGTPFDSTFGGSL